MGVFGDLGLDKVFGGFDASGFFSNLVIGVVVMVFMAGIGLAVFIHIRDKAIYKNPVALIMLKDNGGHKRRDDLKGGIVKGRSGISDFAVKIPRRIKKKTLGYIPDFSKTNADDKVVFLTSGDNMIWQQCEEKLVETEDYEIEVERNGKIEKEIVKTRLVIEPIPIDIKTVTINNIHAVENILEANKLKAATIAIGAFVLMVLVQIIFLFLTTGKG